MKKICRFAISTLLIITTIFISTPSGKIYAQNITVSEEKISDDLYCITSISEFPATGINLFSTTQTKSGSKTVQYVNSSGSVLWYVTVHASFTYNGSSSSCTNASVYAESNSSAWTVTNKSSWRSGNTGYASATGHHHNFLGIETSSVSRTVSISCTANGTLQ